MGLQVHQVSKMYGIQTVLAQVTFTLNEGQRLGLVGPNGCGKSTLLRILAGVEKPDSGVVVYDPPGLRMGYLPQGYEPAGKETVEQFLTRTEGDLRALEARLEELAGRMVSEASRPELAQEYDETLARLEVAAQAARRGPEVLAMLGLDGLSGSLPVEKLSGGQKTRLALAGILLTGPQLLLLDEPTNHLDIVMLELLEDWLRRLPIPVLVVSHDRVFLQRVATGILELEPVGHTVRLYAGGYDAYVQEKEAERQRQWQEYTDQQQEIGRLRRAAACVRSQARFHKGGKTDPQKMDAMSAGFFANRGKEVVQKAKNIEKRIGRLLTVERVEKPARSWQMKIEFSGVESSGRDVLVLEDLAVGYGDKELLSHLNLILRYGQRVAMVGANGSGKTTLVRTLAGQLPPLAGQVRLGANVRLGYMAQEQENLKPDQNALEALGQRCALGETEMRGFLSKFLFKGDEVFVPAAQLSYGQRARLMLACLAASGANCLLLDEPINHLDIPARQQFETALGDFPGTVLAVVHDRAFIQRFASAVWRLVEGGVRVES